MEAQIRDYEEKIEESKQLRKRKEDLKKREKELREQVIANKAHMQSHKCNTSEAAECWKRFEQLNSVGRNTEDV